MIMIMCPTNCRDTDAYRAMLINNNKFVRLDNILINMNN